MVASHKSKSTGSNGGPGLIKFYSNSCKTVDLTSVLPAFQVEFGHTATLPIVNAKICGFSGKVLVLTDSTVHNQVVYKALLRNFHLSIEVNSTFPHLELVTDSDASQFVAEFDVMSTNSLQQLAIACPNLQRLNLHQSKKFTRIMYHSKLLS